MARLSKKIKAIIGKIWHRGSGGGRKSRNKLTVFATVSWHLVSREIASMVAGLGEITFDINKSSGREIFIGRDTHIIIVGAGNQFWLLARRSVPARRDKIKNRNSWREQGNISKFHHANNAMSAALIIARGNCSLRKCGSQ